MKRFGTAAAAAAFSACTAAAGASYVSAVPAPANGAFLGAFVNPQGLRRPPRAAFADATGALESQMRSAGATRGLALHLHFFGWKALASVASDPSVSDDFAKGRTPVLTWTCGDALTRIAEGADDDLIVQTAQAIGALHRPVMLRWFHEFNLNLHGERANGQSPLAFTARDTDGQSREFIAAWRHVHDVFARTGATNVAWVWNPESGVRSIERTQPMSFFPGAAYVDWIGGDFYDRRAAGFAATAQPFYDMAHGNQPSIPLIVVETGEQAGSGLQAQYIQDIGTTLPTKFPQIKAVMYFDAPGIAPNNWALTPAAIDALAKLANSSYFRPMPASGVGFDSKFDAARTGAK
jgi:hypothetical protein